MTDKAASKSPHPAVEELIKSDKESFIAAASILIKFATNVLNQPAEPKFRKIRLGNKQVMEKLLPVSGGMECLFAMGFEESEDRDFLCLPQTCDLSVIRDICSEIEREHDRVLKVSFILILPCMLVCFFVETLLVSIFFILFFFSYRS